MREVHHCPLYRRPLHHCCSQHKAYLHIIFFKGVLAQKVCQINIWPGDGLCLQYEPQTYLKIKVFFVIIPPPPPPTYSIQHTVLCIFISYLKIENYFSVLRIERIFKILMTFTYYRNQAMYCLFSPVVNNILKEMVEYS
jgi:hypothetical protein